MKIEAPKPSSNDNQIRESKKAEVKIEAKQDIEPEVKVEQPEAKPSLATA